MNTKILIQLLIINNNKLIMECVCVCVMMLYVAGALLQPYATRTIFETLKRSCMHVCVCTALY